MQTEVQSNISTLFTVVGTGVQQIPITGTWDDASAWDQHGATQVGNVQLFLGSAFGSLLGYTCFAVGWVAGHGASLYGHLLYSGRRSHGRGDA